MIKTINGADASIIPACNGTDSATSQSVTNTVLSSVSVPVGVIDTNTTIRIKALYRKGVANLTAYDASIYWSSGTTIDASSRLLGSLRINGESSVTCIQRYVFFDLRILPSLDYRAFTFNTTANTENDFLLFTPTVSTISFNSVNNFVGGGYILACAARVTISRTNDDILCSYIYVDI